MTASKARFFFLWTLLLLVSESSLFGQWLSGWEYRKSITIQHTQVVGGPHTDFPVLISITADDALKSPSGLVSSTTGDDLRFTDSDGETLLDFDIEKYDPAAGDLVAWVKIPSLPSATDKILYLYFGNGSASAYPTPENTWSNGFLGVWHFHYNTLDATANGLDGQYENNIGDVQGKIANAKSFNGSDSYVNLGNPSELDFTTNDWNLSAWILTTNSSDDMVVFNKGAYQIFGGENHYCHGISSEYGFIQVDDGTNDYEAVGNSSLSDGRWHYLFSQRNGDTIYVFIDGKLESNQVLSANFTLDVSSYLALIGGGELILFGSAYLVNVFDGVIDEPRVAVGARDEDWITTEYNNQNDPASFYQLGVLECVRKATATPDMDTLCSGETTNIELSCDFSGSSFTANVLYHGSEIQGANGAITGTKWLRDQLTNTGTSYDSVVYEIIPYGPGPWHCRGRPDTAVVWVEPVVTVQAVGDTICSDSSTSIVVTSNCSSTSGIRYTWTVVDNPNVTGESGSVYPGLPVGTPIQQTLTNLSDQAQEVVYTIIPWTVGANGENQCAGTSKSVSVWVEPLPQIALSNHTDTVCSLDTVKVNVTSTSTPTHPVRFAYEVLPDDPQKISHEVIGDSTGLTNGAEITVSLENQSDTVQRVVLWVESYTVDGVGNRHCEGGVDSTEVWVEPVPQVTLVPQHDTLCDGDTTSIQITSPTMPTHPVRFDYGVSVGDPSLHYEIVGDSVGLGKNEEIRVVFTNTGDTARRAVIRVESYTVDGVGNRHCEGGVDSTEVWVEPVPQVTLVPRYDTLCDGGVTAWQLTSPTVPTHPVKFSYTIEPEDSSMVRISVGQIQVDLNKGDVLHDTIRNLSDVPQKIHFIVQSYTVDGFGNIRCGGVSDTATVWVNPTPRIILTPDTARICNGQAISVRLTSPTQVTQGVVDYDYITLLSTQPDSLLGITPTGTALQWGSVLEDTIFNLTDTLQTARYIVTPMARGLAYLGCVDGITDTVRVTVHPDPAQSMKIIRNNTCAGANKGILTVHTARGTSPFLFHWIGPDMDTVMTEDTLYDLYGGYYWVTVTDNYGCENELYEIINSPSRIPLVVRAFRKEPNRRYNVSCAGGSDGIAYVYVDVVNANYPPYTYWFTDRNGDTLATNTFPVPGIFKGDSILDLPAGTYYVEMVDSVRCRVRDSIEITEPPPIRVKMHSPVYTDPYNISCRGFNDGRIIVDSVTGGNGWYKYFWTEGEVSDTGGGLIPTNRNQQDLYGGTYYLEVTDTLGCTGHDSITLLEPEGIELVDTVLSRSPDGRYNISCYGAQDGSISLVLEGGSGTYSYYWSTADGSGIDTTARDQTDLTAGTYTVKVMDESTCYRIWSFTLTQPDPITIDDSLSLAPDGLHNISCAGGDDGAIDLRVHGGSEGNYRYFWSTADGAGIIPYAEDQSGLTAGTYHVEVLDSNGCRAEAEYTLQEPDPLEITLVPQHISCDPGYDDGEVHSEVTGGTGNGTYQYLWSNNATTPDITDLTAGWYTLLVTDMNGCTAYDSVEILLPPPLKMSLRVSDYHGMNISCYGERDGSIEVTILSGTPAYQYAWNGPDGFVSTDSSIYHLPAGTYRLHVTDAKHCIGDTTLELVQPAPITVEVTTSQSHSGGYNLNCFGDSDGFILLNVKGGTPGYIYLWDNGTEESSLENIPAGEYHVEIKDVNGCESDTTVRLIQPAQLTVEMIVKNTYCPDMNDGAVQAVVAGGVGPYDYFWTTGDVSEGISEIVPGEYGVTVTDANMCQISDTVTVKSDRPQCLEIPSAFSPNGDGVNDRWEIGKVELYPDVVVEIYNRWGELLYRSSRGYTDPWDGTRRGKPLPMDSYYYVIDLHNGTKPITGNVTIVR